MKTATYNPDTHRLVPVERSYDTRAKQIIAFNTEKGDLDDKLEAANKAMLSAAPQPEPVEVEPVALIDGNDERVLFPSDVMFHYWIGRNCTPLYTAPPDYEEIKRQLKVMREQLEEYRKDAERYRWLRDTQDGKTIRNMFRQEWDGAIDAALASVKGGA